MNCPRCGNKKLEAVTVQSVELELCRSCRGVWFAGDRMKAVLDAQKKDLVSSAIADSWKDGAPKKEAKPKKPYACPRCGGALDRYRYAGTSGILVDHCGKGCGVWVDDGEIREIYEYIHKACNPSKEKKLILELRTEAADEDRKELSFIDQATDLNEGKGMLGGMGHIVQHLYHGLYKLGL
jgi:Zn-finger nucleic acid-binding protein